MACKIVVNDVGHGVFIDVQTSNGRSAIIDCGGGDGDSDSVPLPATSPTGQLEPLDYLVLSHPHRDHIKHLPLLARLFYVEVLAHNRTISKEKLLEENEDALEPPNRECVETYYEYDAEYTASVPYEKSPTNPKWGDGTTMHCFCNHDESMGINDLSMAVFIVSGETAVLYGADLEQAGWEALLANPDFVSMLRKTKVLIASHHGRESGFCRDAFEYLHPLITIVSDGPVMGTSVTPRYDEVTDGIMFNGDKRRVLTTRKDEKVIIDIDDYGNLCIRFGLPPTVSC